MMGKERFYIFEDDVRGNFGEVDKPLKNTEIVDLLNELSDENNILNKNEDDLKECTIENIKLKEENEKLRKELNDCEKFRYQVFKRIGELSDE